MHNYVEVNKNIAPCSYPLRHLYELLDEGASGKVYPVLDLSQGFFQQHLIDMRPLLFQFQVLDNMHMSDLLRA